MKRTDEVLIAELAAAQHGVVTRAQLLAVGVARGRIDRRVETGRLRVVHRGVYQVGPIALPRAREMAAVLACGQGAVVSYRSAGLLWEMLLPGPKSIAVDVTICGRDRGRRPGIRPHRVARMDRAEVRSIDRIPVTSPSRTLVDLAGILPSRELERALARADRKNLVNPARLKSRVARYGQRRGVARLQRILDSVTDPAMTRSDAEELFRDLVLSVDLPEPEANRKVAGHEVDFVWRARRLVVEVDGYAFHASHDQFKTDRSRDADITAAGYRVLRVSWSQLTNKPTRLLVRLAQALAWSSNH